MINLCDIIKASSTKNKNRSHSTSPYQYDNRVYVHDPSTENGIVSTHASHRSAQSPEIEAGRTKLHRLLDEVLDKADSEETYNPDSETERQKRRRQRRRIHSASDNSKNQPIITNAPQIPHIPVLAQVSERPDPSILRLRYNPYEAGDRTSDIARSKPVELIPKYNIDDQRLTQYSSRSNPPLFYDDTNIADRAATATDAYANPKRTARTRLETDQEAKMRHNGGHIEQRRQHQFNNDGVYVDSISKNRGQIRSAWVEPEVDNNLYRRNDYRDEYIMAKRSVLNTKNIISSIHDELQHIVLPKSEDYHA
ncbi:hypothetical protein I4U23_024838 [Adineta vaga]|nr:hypothetical protein I4U23_024838 [Adineta vaga]